MYYNYNYSKTAAGLAVSFVNVGYNEVGISMSVFFSPTFGAEEEFTCNGGTV